MSKIQRVKGFAKFPNGFKVLSPQAIDARLVADDVEYLNSIKEVGATYPGLRVYVISEEKYYSYLPDEVGTYDFREDTLSLTNEQIAAINSSITKAKVLSYDQLVSSAITEITTGSTEGTIRAGGIDIPVNGLKALAFKGSLTKEDVGLDQVNNVAITENQVNKIGENTTSIYKANEKIEAITSKISEEASSTNKIPSESQVKSWIVSGAGRILTYNTSGDLFPTKTSLVSGPWYYEGDSVTPKLGDKATVISDESWSNKQVLYTYGTLKWSKYAELNQPLTAEQILALDSGITATKIDKYDTQAKASLEHIENRSNPHGVTKSQLGLGKVDNTSDLEKPLSTAAKQKNDEQDLIINTAAENAKRALDLANGVTHNYAFDSYTDMVAALRAASQDDYRIGDNLLIRDKDQPDWWISNKLETSSVEYGYYQILELEGKIDLSSYETKEEAKTLKEELEKKIKTHTDDTSNPHKVTKAQIGLGNTVNGAQINVIEKVSINGTEVVPVDKTVDLIIDSYSKKETTQLLDNKVDKIIGRGLSEANFTSAEKTKLSNIESEAERNTIENIEIDGISAIVDSTSKKATVTGLTKTTDFKAEITKLSNSDLGLQSKISNLSDELKTEVTIRSSEAKSLSDQITNIAGLIPTQATTVNQLADKDFVNSSISTNTATFRGTYNLTESEFNALPWQTTTPGSDYYVSNNDYAYLLSTDSTTSALSYKRYKYTLATEANNTGSWWFEYEVNTSGFTEEQLKALNSGITAGVVNKVSENTKSIQGVNDDLTSFKDKVEKTYHTPYKAMSDTNPKYTIDEFPYSISTGADTIVIRRGTYAEGVEGALNPRVRTFLINPKKIEGNRIVEYDLEETLGGIYIDQDDTITIDIYGTWDQDYVIWGVMIWPY